MIRPLHKTMRAVGQGMFCSALVAVPLAFAIAYLSTVGLVTVLLTTGAGLITLANALKRREQRQRGGAR